MVLKDHINLPGFACNVSSPTKIFKKILLLVLLLLLFVLIYKLSLCDTCVQHPLRGPNDDRFGPRFFPCNDIYNTDYRKMARRVAKELNLEGIVRQVAFFPV